MTGNYVNKIEGDVIESFLASLSDVTYYSKKTKQNSFNSCAGMLSPCAGADARGSCGFSCLTRSKT